MEKLELIVIGLLGALTFYLISPIFDVLFFGVLTAYALKVLVKRLGKRFDERLVIGVLSFGVFAVIVGGLYFLATNASLITLEIINLSERATGAIETLLETYNLEVLTTYVSTGVSYVEDYLRSAVFDFASSIHLAFLNVFIYFVVVFFGYREGDKVYSIFINLVERLDESDESFLKETISFVEQLTKDVFVIYGTYALITTAIAGIGFYLIGMVFLGHPMPFFWLLAIIAGLAAFFRGFTSAVVLVPVILYYFVMGEVWLAFWLTVFSFFGLALIPEAFILPYLGASKIDEGYLTFLIGFLSGVLVFGVKGLILGPILLITFKHLVQEQLELL